MHPMLQMSIALVYSEAFRITSGALYHRVTTYSVLNSFSSSNPLPNPRSQSFTSHSLFSSIFDGFKSQ